MLSPKECLPSIIIPFCILWLFGVFAPSTAKMLTPPKYDSSTSLQPEFTVQAKLSEDYYQPPGSKKFVHITAHRIVITVAKRDPSQPSHIPYTNQPVHIKVKESDVPVVLQRNGRLEKSVFKAGKVYIVQSNAAGRVSFSIPITQDDLSRSQNDLVSSIRLPPLLLRTDFMRPGHWIVSHPDYAAFHRLSDVKAPTLISINPKLSKPQAEATSKMLNNLMNRALQSVPTMTTEDESTGKLRKRSLTKGHEYSSDAWKDNELPYVPSTDVLASYQVRSGDYIHYDRVLHRRSLVPTSGDWSFVLIANSDTPDISFSNDISEIRTVFPENTSNHSRLAKRDFAELWDKIKSKAVNAIDESGSKIQDQFKQIEVVSHQNDVLVFMTDAAGTVKEWVVGSVKAVLLVIKKVLESIQIGFKKLLESVRNLFRWDSVLRTQKWLKIYTAGCVPLARRLIEVQNDRLQRFMANASTDFHDSINFVANKWGANITLKSLPGKLQSNMNSTSKNSRSTSSMSSTPSNMLKDTMKGVEHSMGEDLFLNNIHEAKIDVKNDTISQLRDITGRFITELRAQGLFDDPAFRNVQAKLVTFQENTNIFNKSVGYLLAFIDAIYQTFQKFITKAVVTALRLIPFIDSYMLAFLSFQIRIPLLYDFYNSVIAQNQHTLALGDLYYLLIAMHNTYAYMLYHKGQEPFTAVDMKIFESQPNLMLWSFTYQNHELLADVDKAAKEKKMNQWLDWMPRGQVVWTTYFSVIMSYVEGGFATMLIKGTLEPYTAWLQGIGFYPLDQATDPSQETLVKTVENCDIYWFVWYAQWYIAIILKVVSQYHGAFGLNDVIFKHLAALLLATPQGGLAVMILNNVYRKVNWKDPARVAVTLQTTGAWFFDTLGYYLYLLPQPVRFPALVASDSMMLAFYTARFHTMLGTGKFWLVD